MSHPRITIITPSYNQAQYLEETIDSVLSQGYPNLEYMVVDGGSNDGSKEIIRKYSDHLTWWVSEKDGGQTDAILKGMRRMTGDVFNWINSDDLLSSDSLKIVGEVFSDKEVSCLTGPIVMFGGRKEKLLPPVHFQGDSIIRTIGLDSYNQPGTFFRTEQIKTFGLPDVRLHYVMDKEWFIRYLLYFGISGIRTTNVPLARYREHDQTKTASQGDVFMDEYADVIRAYCSHAGESGAAGLITEKYGDRGFSVPEGIPIPDKALVHQLAGMFLLRRYYQITNKASFQYAKRMLETIQWSICDLPEKMETLHREMEHELKAGSWLKYRLRKIWW